MKQIHSLPEPSEFGFRWKPYEKARQKLKRVEGKRKEARRQEAELQRRIEDTKRGDVKRLAESILNGQAEPDVASEAIPELEDLAGKLREQRRLREALEQAEPQAEAELMRTVQEHRGQWIGEVDAAVAKALEEEREAYQRARGIAQNARSTRLYLEALADWTRKAPPTFNVPRDMAIASSVQAWEEDLSRCELRMHERHQNEQLEREATA